VDRRQADDLTIAALRDVARIAGKVAKAAAKA